MIAEQTPIVVSGKEIEVACDSAVAGKWVIIQSLDTGAEKTLHRGSRNRSLW